MRGRGLGVAPSQVVDAWRARSRGRRDRSVVCVTRPSRTSNTVDGPVVVSSSSPSSPRNSTARVPRRASTSAISGSMRASEHPTACANGRAGFVSGPRKLKTVGTRSSRRTGPAWAIAGWNIGANRNAMPASARQRSTPPASRSIAHAERLEHVGRATVRARGPVPVLGDRHAGAGHDDRADRRDVERAAAVAARADDVDGRRRRCAPGSRTRASCARAPRPRRRSRPWCEAPSGSRRSGPAWPRRP